MPEDDDLKEVLNRPEARRRGRPNEPDHLVVMTIRVRPDQARTLRALENYNKFIREAIDKLDAA